MVRIMDDDESSQEDEVYLAGETNAQALIGDKIVEQEEYMAFLRAQLEDFLPPHDKKQDDFIAKLPNLLFLPENANANVEKIYQELCGKQTRLLKIQQERNDITTWLWSFYKQELPNVTHQHARKKVKKLFAGKQKFYVISKQVEDMLYKLHAITQ